MLSEDSNPGVSVRSFYDQTYDEVPESSQKQSSSCDPRRRFNMPPKKLALVGGMTCFFVLLGILIIVVIVKETGNDSKDDPIVDKCIRGVDQIRLPTSAVPNAYSVTLQPSISTFNFHGYLQLDFDVTKETSCLYLHVRDVKIDESTVNIVDSSKKAYSVEKIELFDDAREYVIFYFEESLEIGTNYVISMEYVGYLNTDMIGFYRSSYTDENGQVNYILSTQFQPTYARMSFPCFDEPQLKATFEIQIILKESYQYTAISNNREISRGPPTRSLDPSVNPSELIQFSFEKTVKMASYLVAYAIGELSYIEDNTASPLIRVYARPSQIAKAEFSLWMARRVTLFFDDYFQYPYNASFAKMDMIAIPDFAAGAMENWGLITYRETALLMDEQTASISDKQYVATVVAHEIAHMTFGNLVTMEWWSDLWLNEAFATYMSYVATDAVIPDWKIFELFMEDSYQYALSIDALSTTHPLLIEVSEPGEIEQIFDAITYDKGGSVLRQLDDFLELNQANWFRDGLRYYVKKFEYANAKTSDLWDALSFVANANNKIDIKSLMENWTNKGGFPFVTLERLNERLSVVQKPFSAFPPQKEEPYWWIPFSYFTDVDLAPKTASFVDQSESVVISPEAKWYKANFKHSSFIHVNYPASNWEALSDVIAQKDSVLGVYDRFGLVGDSFSLARAGHLSIDIPHDIVKAFYLVEKEYLVWASAFFHISSFRSILREEYTDIYAAYANYICQVISPIAEEFGWDGEPNEPLQVTQLRALALNYAVTCGNETFVNEALRRWVLFQNDTSVLPPDHRSFVYKLVVAKGDESTFDDMLGRYEREQDVQEKRRLLSSLGATTDPSLIERSLNISVSERVRSQDTYTLYYSIAKNPIGQIPAWEFLQANWDIFEARYGGGGLTMGRFITATTADFTSATRYTEVETFFNEHPVESGSNAIKQSLESIKGNGQFMTQNKELIEKYFGLN